MITYYEFLEALSTIRKFKKQVPLLYKEMEEEVSSISKFVNVVHPGIERIESNGPDRPIERNYPGLGQALDEGTFGHQECRKKNGRRDKGTLSVRQSANETVAH